MTPFALLEAQAVARLVSLLEATARSRTPLVKIPKLLEKEFANVVVTAQPGAKLEPACIAPVGLSSQLLLRTMVPT